MHLSKTLMYANNELCCMRRKKAQAILFIQRMLFKTLFQLGGYLAMKVHFCSSKHFSMQKGASLATNA